DCQPRGSQYARTTRYLRHNSSTAACTSERGIWPPHSAGFQIVGRRSGPYRGVNRQPSNVSARIAVQSSVSEPSNPRQICDPAGGCGLDTWVDSHKPAGSHEPMPATIRLPKNLSAWAGSVSSSSAASASIASRSTWSHPAYTNRWICRRSLLSRYDRCAGGTRWNLNTSGRFASAVRCAVDCSAGSHAFVVSTARPLIPARPRRWVSATRTILLLTVYNPVSSCSANVIGLPNRAVAELVTTSMRPSLGSRTNSSPMRTWSASGPYRSIACNGRYTLSTCSTAVASSWISGVGHGMPIGSPGSYSYTPPQPQPRSAHP